jgi:hypothetical protein
MGVPDFELDFIGATRYHGLNSSKEADLAYKPLSIRPNNTDWPTIVFESGYSESLHRLRIDASWWLRASGGRVNIVVVVSVNRQQLALRIETWELVPIPASGRRSALRSASTVTHIPAKMHEITVSRTVAGAPLTVIGAPLSLEFQKIFLYPAVAPQTDITLTGQYLSNMADLVLL